MKEEYDKLIAQLETILPFSVTPSRNLVVQLRESKDITLNTKLTVTALHNFIEEGGICCEIVGIGEEEEVVICGLTHLLIPKSNPFYKEIIKYQSKRIKWIERQ